LGFGRSKMSPEEAKKRKEMLKARPPETMPIELADKTYRVTGIEVELMLPPGCSDSKAPKKWFWNYKLEEIK